MRHALLSVVALCGFGGVAHANTITQSFTVSFHNVDEASESSNGFQQFNANLGMLNSVVAGFSGNILFAPTAASGKYTVTYNGFAGGSGSPSLVVSGNVTDMFQTNVPVDPGSVAGVNGFANYFLAFIDLSVTDGTVLTGSTATGTLTYNYTPAAATPEPSSVVMLGTGLLGLAGFIRRRLA